MAGAPGRPARTFGSPRRPAVSRPAPKLPPGLRSLVERARRSKARTAADADLARRLQDGVEAAGAADGLAFYVHDGVVSVYGDAATAAARDAILDAVVAQAGVRRVVDHLRVGGG